MTDNLWRELESIEDQERRRRNAGDPDEYFGGCPDCGYPGRHDDILNVGPVHWCVCRIHLTKWRVGSNLFSAWRHEHERVWLDNEIFLSTCREVDCLQSRQFLQQCPACGHRIGCNPGWCGVCNDHAETALHRPKDDLL